MPVGQTSKDVRRLLVPHCAEQKQVFGASFQYVTYVECGIQGSRTEAPECLQDGVKRFHLAILGR